MFSSLAHQGKSGKCFYGPLQEAPLVMFHLRFYINKTSWTMPCVLASIVPRVTIRHPAVRMSLLVLMSSH
jgi:hypothetical protein